MTQFSANGEVGFRFLSVDFDVKEDVQYSIDGSSNTVNGTLPTSGEVGLLITVHNESTSTNLVQLINTSLTINGKNDTAAPGTDVELVPGDTFQFVFKTSTTLEAV